MPPEMDVRRIIELTRAIDALLLTWEPEPSLNEVIAAQVQSLAGAISATTDPGPTLNQVKNTWTTSWRTSCSEMRPEGPSLIEVGLADV
jgi:hypothetical protein